MIDKKLLSEAQRFNLRREGLANKVELVSYCLMPNHFHLLLYQYDKEGITKLMRSIATGYAMYFNKRHKRIGSLFQGTYKASRVQSDSYWMHISRYIHLNPADLGDFRDYPYSSYKIFMGKTHTEWVHPEKVLDSFKNRKEYEKFVESYLEQRNDLKEISRLLANSKELEED